MDIFGARTVKIMNHLRTRNRVLKSQKNRGFTLIELIVVIVIIAILAGIAAIAYNFFIERANLSAKVSVSTQVAKIVQADSAVNQAPAVNLDAARVPLQNSSSLRFADLPFGVDMPSDTSALVLSDGLIYVSFDDGTACTGMTFPAEPGGAPTGEWTCGEMTLPSPATGVTVTPGNGTLFVSWTPAADSSGVTEYMASTTPGGLFCTVPASQTSCTINGVVNGTEYAVTVNARSASGAGEVSEASAEVLPTGVPSAPRNPNLTGTATSVVASWVVPATDGGTAILSYTSTTNSGESCTATAPATTCEITGLDPAFSYTMTVVATNASGDSVPSGASSAGSPGGVPNPPQALSFTEGLESLTASWSAPLQAAESNVTSYTVTSDSGDSCTVSVPTLSCTITGMDPNLVHVITAVATNSTGDSEPSNAADSTTSWRCDAPFFQSGPNPTDVCTQTSGYTYTTVVSSYTIVGSFETAGGCPGGWNYENYGWIAYCRLYQPNYSSSLNAPPAGWFNDGSQYRINEPKQGWIVPAGTLSCPSGYTADGAGPSDTCTATAPYTYTQVVTGSRIIDSQQTDLDVCPAGYNYENYNWTSYCRTYEIFYGPSLNSPPYGWTDDGTQYVSVTSKQ